MVYSELSIGVLPMMESPKRKRNTWLSRFARRETIKIPVFLCVVLILFLIPQHPAHAFLNWIGDTFKDLVAGLLYGIFWLFSLFVTLAAALFVWVLDTKNFSALMNQGAIYTVWQTVRDFCNIFFILTLLFSAFATIFQLDKYEWKKTIPTLIIMALLVNFSFPISRFVIDVANVPMYFFAQNTVKGGSGTINSTSGKVLSASNIREIILPGSQSADRNASTFELPHLFVAIICMFLFGISFLVLALLLLIRMIALAILVMFSPIGFAGLITPALHKFASEWWSKLFKWAFYGPISVMMVLVAVRVMEAAGEIFGQTMKMQNVAAGGVSNTTFLSGVAFLAIPIVLFWIAITTAEKYSNDMSGMGIKFGSQIGRWAGKQTRGAAIWTAKAPFKGVDNLSRNKISGTALGIRDAWRNRQSAWWGGSDIDNRRKETRERVSSSLRRRGTTTQEVQKKATEYEKENVTDEKLRDLVKVNGDVAAAMVLAKQGKLSVEEFEKIRLSLGNDPNDPVIKLLEGKVKEKQLDIIIDYKMRSSSSADRISELKSSRGLSDDQAKSEVYKEVAAEEMKKLDPSKWRAQDLRSMFSLNESGKEVKYTSRAIYDASGIMTDVKLFDESGAEIKSEAANRLRGRIIGTSSVFNAFNDKNKEKILEDMNGEKFLAGRKAGLW